MGEDKFMNKLKVIGSLVLVSFVIVSALAGPATAAASNQSFLAQEENETTTTTTTTTTTATTTQSCEPGDNEPSLTQSRLYAPEKVLKSGEPGKISGGFKVANTANCPVKVSITMQVPSGMQIEGASDVMTGGAGMVAADFTVKPGNIRSIRASVFSENTGSRTVTADIQYWPVGHDDMAKQIDGISMSFDVQEPVTPDEKNSGSTLLGGYSTTTVIIGILAFLLLIALVGLVAK